MYRSGDHPDDRGDLRIHPRASYILKGQIQHVLLLLVMIPGAVWLAEPGLVGGDFLGIADRQWLLFMIAVPVIHQVIVALVFRLQLVYGLLTRVFGRADMIVWGVIFLPLLALRVVTILALAAAAPGGIAGPRWISVAGGSLLLIPALYTLYSVFRWFGLRRALGGDHFRRHFRETPLERRGAFRYSGNAMYSFAFLLLWGAALIVGSRAALAGALFQHAYIWVHWYCTEQPDMQVLYGG